MAKFNDQYPNKNIVNLTKYKNEQKALKVLLYANMLVMAANILVMIWQKVG